MGFEEKPTLASYRWLFAAVSITALVTIILGNLTANLNMEMACPDWPTCFGTLLPPGLVNSNHPPLTSVPSPIYLDYAHRAATGLTFLGVILAYVVAIKTAPRQSLLQYGLLGALAMMVVEISLSGIAILLAKTIFPPIYHLLLAYLILSLILFATAAVFQQNPTNGRISLHEPFSRLGLASLAAIMGITLSGSLLAEYPHLNTCTSWPFCSGSSPYTWIINSHRILTGIAALLMISFLITSWKKYYQNHVLLPAASVAGTLLAAQVATGVFKVLRGSPLELLALHAAATAGIWAALALAVSWSMQNTVKSTDYKQAPTLHRNVLQKIGAFFWLTKPLIVLLLLVTTFSGMVVGKGAIPDLSVLLATLFGGALAAGGASAVNQYLDREIDKLMQRTASRPLPAGLLTPAEAMAFGLVLCILSFFLMALFVNLLSALLSLAGMIYYIVIYSLLLKKATVQNIVIGGGAGAIPPLVGWAAVTGSLDVPALFLFAIIFLWTPPHFWALALVRKNDYSRAGIPMLPVVQGEAETRKQIFIYTLELVIITLLLPFFGITRQIYLFSALVLGVGMILYAWRILRQGGNKNAWQMYKYSSRYLGLIFLAMVLDVLLLV